MRAPLFADVGQWSAANHKKSPYHLTCIKKPVPWQTGLPLEFTDHIPPIVLGGRSASLAETRIFRDTYNRELTCRRNPRLGTAFYGGQERLIFILKIVIQSFHVFAVVLTRTYRWNLSFVAPFIGESNLADDWVCKTHERGGSQHKEVSLDAGGEA